MLAASRSARRTAGSSAGELAAQLEAAVHAERRDSRPPTTQPILSAGSALAIQRRHTLARRGAVRRGLGGGPRPGLLPGAAAGSAGLGALGRRSAARYRAADHAGGDVARARRAIERTSGLHVATPAGGLAPWLSWRRALMGGGLAFGGLGTVAGDLHRDAAARHRAGGHAGRVRRARGSRAAPPGRLREPARPIRRSAPRSPRPSGWTCRSRPP